MNEISTIDDLKSISNEQLMQELSQSLSVTVQSLQWSAKVWAEAESRGIDLSDLRHGIMAYIPMIASNKLDARVVITYAGQKTLLSAVSQLPIDKQGELMDSGYVPFVKIDEQGNKIEVQTHISKLAAKDIFQVFNGDRIREPNEQYKLLAAQSSAKKKLTKKTYRMTKKVRIEGDAVVIGNSATSISAIVDILSQYYETDILRKLAVAAEKEGYIGTKASSELLNSI